ncbi:MAG: NfeD family protein, partial [Tissierellaceae bacterium]
VLAMDSVVNAILSISIAIIITTIITIVLVKRGFESKLFKSVVLTSEHRTEKGYVSSRASEELLSKRGITVSELRPSGFVEIDGKRVDVLSDEGFMSIGTEVEVVRIEGSKIFVRRI